MRYLATIVLPYMWLYPSIRACAHCLCLLHDTVQHYHSQRLDSWLTRGCYRTVSAPVTISLSHNNHHIFISQTRPPSYIYLTG
ncbi:hypothetical protein BJ166DRAFT_264660 [Pestalotiopsis sp. NC0098]|nr:hypothetical protein BJ166DRAFT_264660 [Pestalotiopsis sp. NC0098]